MFTFNEVVTRGTGNIVLKPRSNGAPATFDIADTSAVVSNDVTQGSYGPVYTTLIVTTSAPLLSSVHYDVSITSDSFTDAVGLKYAGCVVAEYPASGAACSEP